MNILLGVNDKMKLYNVYRLCKQNIDFSEKINIESKQSLYSMKNWANAKTIIQTIKKIPALKQYANNLIEAVPESLRDKNEFDIDNNTRNNLVSKINTLYSKMSTIIELYESMGILENQSPNAIDIKLPSCDDLDEYISYLKDINFIFTQCPFLQCEGEVLKFDSVDVGSNWIKLTITATAISMILNNTASILDKALVLRSHYITIQQQEEMLKSVQLKNELAEEQIKTFKQLKDVGVDIVIKQLEKEHGELADPEERDKAERVLDKLILFLDKGGEIYPSLDAPKDVQALFPEIESSLELPDNIVKYLEDKSEGQ